MGQAATKSVFTGVDYLRLTSLDHKPFSAWEAILMPEFLEEEHLGRKPHFRWILGYYGRVGEHCFLGKNENGCMIQLSSHLAWGRWVDASHHSKRCTRIDLQVTYPLEQEPDSYLHEAWELGKQRKYGRGRPTELQLIDTNYGAKMLTVGSRQSELYGRMYDKYKESRMKEYQSCVRWEIEVKGKQALDLHGWMLENRQEAFATRSVVHHFWEARGMKPPWEPFQGMVAPEPIKRSKTDETKLAWIESQVRPSIESLVSRGRHLEVARAILGKEASDERVSALSLLLLQESGD